MSSCLLIFTGFTFIPMKQVSIFCIACLFVLKGSTQIVLINTSNNIVKDSLTKNWVVPQIKSSDSIKSISIPDSVAAKRNMLNKTNMTILLAWSGANIVQGSISAGNLQGSPHYFHQMNVYFNIANLAIASYGLFELHRQMNKKLSLFQNLRQQQKIESLLLLNTGLDLSYISTGLYLRERGIQALNDKTKGYGGSLILQGSFLFVFDLIQYIEHRQNGQSMNKFLGNLQVAPTANGLGLVLPL